MSANQWINYNHLYYFWVVVRENGLAGATRKLRLATSTISAQLHTFERSLKVELFRKPGRRLEVTDIGQVVYRYASEIFALGHELRDELEGLSTGRPIRAVIGVSADVPDLVAGQLITPATELSEPIQVSCRREQCPGLLDELLKHTLDVVLTVEKAVSTAGDRFYNHKLGQSGIVLVATPELARQYRPGFPYSLEHAPMLLPSADAPLRRRLTDWFEEIGVQPKIVCEFHDSALMETLGGNGLGIFPAHAIASKKICRRLGTRVVGDVIGIREEFYAVTAHSRIRNRAVLAITRNRLTDPSAENHQPDRPIPIARS